MTLGSKGRGFATAVFGPIARALVRARISPDAVTVAGTLAVVAVALLVLPTGRLLLGAVLIGLTALTDAVDGQMARMLGRTGKWGAFLDSTMDRFADGAIFVGLVLWATHSAAGADAPDGVNDPHWAAAAALACLFIAPVVPYARARAEGLGLKAQVGIAERTDRLVLTLVAVALVGVGLPVAVLTAALGLVALASLITVVQRMTAVYRQASAAVEGGAQ